MTIKYITPKKYMLLIIIVILLFPTKVLGDEFGGGDGSGGSGGGGGLSGGDGDGYGGDNCSSSWWCYQEYTLDEEFRVDWDLYDMYNNPIAKNTAIYAGTNVGFRLYEHRYAKWHVSGRTLHSWTCYYSYSECTGYCTTSTGVDVCCDVRTIDYTVGGAEEIYTEECKQMTIPIAYEAAVKSVSKSIDYEMVINDPNDARCANPEKYGSSMDGVDCHTHKVTETIKGEVSPKYENPVTRNYYYQRYGACINAKTGNIRYLDAPVKKDKNGNYTDPCNKGDSINSDVEYYVDNDDLGDERIHWHVFVPLNTKEIDGYSIFLVGKNELEGRFCASVVERHSENSEYMDYIQPKKTKFTGIISTDKKLVANGCIPKTKINIKVKQNFYNEVKESDTESELIGFKFYYRPIDINNPFPNGIADDSYWKLWEDDKKVGKEEPELEKSFNTITYMATDIDLNGIREYNNYNEYPDWTNLNIDGSSNFIKDYNFIARNSIINNNSFYSLGCGSFNQCPYYIDKNGVRKENPIYQPECSKVREGDVCP